jgi:hypothetical protein
MVFSFDRDSCGNFAMITAAHRAPLPHKRQNFAVFAHRLSTWKCAVWAGNTPEKEFERDVETEHVTSSEAPASESAGTRLSY